MTATLEQEANPQIQPDFSENPYTSSGPRSWPAEAWTNVHLRISCGVGASVNVDIRSGTDDVVISSGKDVAFYVFFKEGEASSSKKALDRRNSETTFFLEGVYLLDDVGEVRQAVEQVVNYVDDLLNGGRFEQCDTLLSKVEVSKISPPVLISLLGITLAAKPKLKFRSILCERAKAELAQKVPADRAERLLKKYA